MKKTIFKALLLSSTVIILDGCRTLDRLHEVGDKPSLSQIQNPVSSRNYQPVTMPMPTPILAEKKVNSLWQPGAQGFFKDQRAKGIGDILTVKVAMNDSAEVKDNSTFSRKTDSSVAAGNFLGFESQFSNLFPNSINPSKLIGVTSAPDHTADGTIKRSEKINLVVPATVTQILPNGNFIIVGNQEMRVNNEVRELRLTGIVRPEDILSDNTIDYIKMAEARIGYGGRGDLTDFQQIPVGQQVVNVLSPF